MTNKWQRFHTTHSSITVNKPFVDTSDHTEDLYRESQQNRCHINGIPLSDYGKIYNFKKNEGYELFLEEVLLKDMTVNQEQKNSIVNYLKSTFYQGGLMNPLSGGLSESFMKKNEQTGEEEPFLGIDTDSKDISVNIVTTKDGLKVQEFLTLKEMFSSEGIVRPDKGKDFVIQAQGTINVNFTSDPGNPAISVESNMISYGNSKVQSMLDKRSLGQCIVDFFIRILGLNQVADISPLTPDKGIPSRETKKLTGESQSDIKDIKQTLNDLKNEQNVEKMKDISENKNQHKPN